MAPSSGAELAWRRGMARSGVRGSERVGLVALLVAILGCGGSLPVPASAEQPAGAFERVPYPPPPARPELVPEAPRSDAVWVDGEWRWEGTRWAWLLGAWVVPPTGSDGYARWAWKRDRRGQLYVAPGSWRSASGKTVAMPRPLALARAGEGDVVEETGLLVEVGRNRAPAPPPRARPARTRRAPCKFDCAMAGNDVP
jgi:hypothetical protein